MKKLKNIHPGEILLEEFLVPLEISAYRLSKDLGIPQTRISEIIKGNRRITADTALRLSKYFGNSAKFWLGVQDDFDIEEAVISSNRESVNRIKEYEADQSQQITSRNKTLAGKRIKAALEATYVKEKPAKTYRLVAKKK